MRAGKTQSKNKKHTKAKGALRGNNREKGALTKQWQYYGGFCVGKQSKGGIGCNDDDVYYSEVGNNDTPRAIDDDDVDAK